MGGAGDLVLKISNIGDRNFWPVGWPEGPKIGRVIILAILHTHLQGISISIKNKKVMLVESFFFF